MKKLKVPEVEIEIGDNLYLQIKDITYTPGEPEVRYYKDGSGYPGSEAEIDWRNEKLIIRKTEYKTQVGGRSAKKEVNDYDFDIDSEFANNYYDELLQKTEEVLNEN